MNTLNRLNEKRHEDGGFTLVELLVVIVILGILSAVVVFAVGGITDKGQDSACASEKRALETAEEAFFANASSSVYTTEAALVPAFLRTQSSNFNVKPKAEDPDGAGPGTADWSDYTIIYQADNDCGGTTGADA